MSTGVKKKSSAIRRTIPRFNSMAFPRALRDAIPPLHDGRVLRLDSIDGSASNVVPFGPIVQLRLIVNETGKRSDSFAVLMRLQPEAARKLAVTLETLASQASAPDPGRETD